MGKTERVARFLLGRDFVSFDEIESSLDLSKFEISSALGCIVKSKRITSETLKVGRNRLVKVTAIQERKRESLMPKTPEGKLYHHALYHGAKFVGGAA